MLHPLRRLRAAVVVLALWTLAIRPAVADDSLGLLRGEARTGSPDQNQGGGGSSKSESDSRDSDQSERNRKNRSNLSQDSDEDTQSGMESLVGLGLLGVGAIVTSPFWAPPKMLDDAYSEPGYFGRFPYHEHQPGYVSIVTDGLSGDNPGKSWGGRLRADYGDDFDDMSSINGNLLVDSTLRFGFDSGFEYRRQSHLNSSHDDLWIGDANVLFRFAQHERLVMHTGLGFNWLSDRAATDYGFNFTYRADWFPIEPWIVTGEMDLGTMGHEFMVHLRTTAGVRWRHVEPYVGYDLLDVGRFQSNQFLAGLRVWF